MNKKTILLFGGTSEERLVSVASAQNLAVQYDFSELVYQDKLGQLYLVSKNQLQNHENVFVTEFMPQSELFAVDLKSALDYFKGKIIFLGLHGAEGENGEIQSLLENHQIQFTGSGSKASHTAFEKNLAKSVILNTDMQMPVEIKFNRGQIDQLKDKFEKFITAHKKVVLKPTTSGSSFGLYIVDNLNDLLTALEQIKLGSFNDYLMENFITGRELTVGVVQEGNELIALPASEIILNAGRSFDYNGKYLGSGSTEITPADLTAEQLLSAQELALKAHMAFECYGYSRTDIILTDSGPYFLETNTLPGLSKPSFFPQQLAAASMSFSQFISAQIELANCRYEN